MGKKVCQIKFYHTGFMKEGNTWKNAASFCLYILFVVLHLFDYSNRISSWRTGFVLAVDKERNDHGGLWRDAFDKSIEANVLISTTGLGKRK